MMDSSAAMMNKTLLGAGLFLILLLARAPLAEAQRPVFRAGVNLVKVDLQVTARGVPVPDLTQSDFLLFDDGEPRSIAYFGSESEPLWLLLLLDVSGSMSRFLKEMADASRLALRVLDPGDRVSVMLFGGESAVVQDFTSNHALVSRAIEAGARSHPLGSATRVNAALLDAADFMAESAKDRPGRRAIVILTDNGGMNYRTPNETVLRALHDAGAVLNAIVTRDAQPPAPPRPGLALNLDFTPSDVFFLAAETGGDVIRSGRVADAFGEIVERIRSRYSLHFYSAGGVPGSFHSIRVSLAPAALRRHPGAEVSARSGYYVPETP
jgi:VWFA-related protein